MWCVFDSSFEFDWCIASFKSEQSALRFRDAYLESNPDFFSDWVWMKFYPDVRDDYPEFVDAQCGIAWSW